MYGGTHGKLPQKNGARGAERSRGPQTEGQQGGVRREFLWGDVLRVEVDLGARACNGRSRLEWGGGQGLR